MSYSGGMSEYAQDQQEQENESGMDDMECFYWHEKNRMLLEGFGKINLTAQPDSCIGAAQIAQPRNTLKEQHHGKI